MPAIVIRRQSETWGWLHSWLSSPASAAAPSENSAPPPDVTAVAPPSRGPRVDLPSNAVVRGMSRGQSRSSMMETADGNDHTPYHNLVIFRSSQDFLSILKFLFKISVALQQWCTINHTLLLSSLLDLSLPCHIDYLIARGNIQSKETP